MRFHLPLVPAAVMALAFAPVMFSQESGPIVKIDAVHTFVWGEDSPSGAVSSTVHDPLTGNTIHKLSSAGIEVSSKLGFEHVSPDQAGTYLNYTITVANSTDSPLSVQYGGITVDGLAASPLWVVPQSKSDGKHKHANKSVWPEQLRCFTSGFLSSDHYFWANTSSQILSVAPQSALTVSSVIRDPRVSHSILCSVEGCFPTGTIRYYLLEFA